MANKNFKKLEDTKHLGRADVHIHSNHSDGRPTIAEILDYVETKTDLDVIAITDHNTIDGALEAIELAKKQKYRFDIIIGEEVSSIEGHILGLFLKEVVKKGMSPRHTLEEIKRQGGLAIIPHPFENMRMKLPNQLTMDGVGLITLLRERKYYKGIEVVNATPTLGAENLRASFINNTILGKSETGSSDAHIVEAIGHGYTLFEGKSADDFRHAFFHHQTRAMHTKWGLRSLFKYLFFFIPIGLRMSWYTLWHGRTAPKPQVVNFSEGKN